MKLVLDLIGGTGVYISLAGQNRVFVRKSKEGCKSIINITVSAFIGNLVTPGGIK